MLALNDVQRASDVAAEAAATPGARLARRASATQADDIDVITSMLLGWGRPEAGPDHASAAIDLRALEGPEIDRRFIEILRHAEASLVSAHTEMNEGFGGSSRSLAEDTSRAHWVELAALSARLD